jgi:four helix bundle protein
MAISTARHQPFTQLRVWQASHALALDIGLAVRGFPIEERYGLAAQLKRASLSVPANLAEGHSLWGTASYLRHARIAVGSLAETEYLLIYARDAGFLEVGKVTKLLERATQIRGQLLALIRALQRRV